MKACSRCGVEKPLNFFHRQASNHSGFRSACKECRREDGKAYWKNLRNGASRPMCEITEKRCTVCKVIKPVAEFYQRSPGRYRVACKSCGNAMTRQWQKKNPEKLKVIQRRTRHKHAVWIARQNKVRHERWAVANPGAAAARTKKWYRQNITRARATTKKLKLQRRNAVPKWANLDAIKVFYNEAHRVTLETGVQHHVDHMVPIAHPLVCGLHVEHNLRVIPGVENIAKGNHWWPDMPEPIQCQT